jgi:transcriptional regulator with XRE-family HTH domain
MSGLSKSTIDGYLKKDGYKPSAEHAVRIARALGVTVEYLVTGFETFPAENSILLNPDLRSLAREVQTLPRQDRRLVLQNALNLVAMLRSREKSV